MKNGKRTDPDEIFPVPGTDTVTYVRPTVKDPNIIVGEYTYFADRDFERHVTHHYAFNSTVASDVPPYTIVTGDPARPIRKRFDDGLIELLLRFRWWDLPAEEINALIPVLSSSDLSYVRSELEKRMKERDGQ